MLVAERLKTKLKNHIKQEVYVDGKEQLEVLEAILNVPRHLFIDSGLKNSAYQNRALPIGKKQTISQPSVVALMTACLFNCTKHDTVLEIGTGSGYQTAILASLWSQVYSVERIESLQIKAKQCLQKLDYNNIEYKYADGGQGWNSQSSFQAIMITAQCFEIPIELKNQLADGGSIIAPLGNGDTQELILLSKLSSKGQVRWQEKIIATVKFVPMLQGKA